MIGQREDGIQASLQLRLFAGAFFIAARIVFDDADVEAAAEAIAVAGYFNAGQDCTAATRAYVQRPLFDAFLEQVADLMGTVRIVRRSMNPSLDIEGVLLTMYDGRTNLSIQVAQELKRFFGGKVYSTVIPRNVRLSEAPSHGKPINAYDRTCRGAEAYLALAAEFLRKNNC